MKPDLARRPGSWLKLAPPHWPDNNQSSPVASQPDRKVASWTLQLRRLHLAALILSLPCCRLNALASASLLHIIPVFCARASRVTFAAGETGGDSSLFHLKPLPPLLLAPQAGCASIIAIPLSIIPLYRSKPLSYSARPHNPQYQRKGTGNHGRQSVLQLTVRFVQHPSKPSPCLRRAGTSPTRPTMTTLLPHNDATRVLPTITNHTMILPLNEI